VFPEPHPLVTFALDAALLAMVGAAPIALVYFVYGWYKVRPPRPSLWTLLVISDLLGFVAGVYLAGIAYVRMNERVVPAWALPELSALAAIALLLPIVAHGLFRLRISSSPDLFTPGPRGETGATGPAGPAGPRGEDAA
jgi:hypothetical protein